MKKNYWIDKGNGVPAYGAYFQSRLIATELAIDVNGMVRTGPDLATYQSLMELTGYLRDYLPEWREGQVYFNAINAIAPDIANIIRGESNADPFYNDDNIENAVKVYIREARH